MDRDPYTFFGKSVKRKYSNINWLGDPTYSGYVYIEDVCNMLKAGFIDGPPEMKTMFLKGNMQKFAEFMEDAFNGILPKKIPSNILDNTFLRQGFQDYCMHPALNEKVLLSLKELVKGKRVLEVMAGNGYLARLLSPVCSQYIATDDFSWEPSVPCNEVEKLGAEHALEKYGRNVDFLLISWPPTGPMVYSLLKQMRLTHVDLRLIYIGTKFNESHLFSADRDFYDSAKFCVSDTVDAIRKDWQSWGGYPDRLYLVK